MIVYASKQPTYIPGIIPNHYYGGTSYTYGGHFDYGNSKTVVLIMALIFTGASITEFVLWIIGIVNAVKINALVNGRATMLIIFSIFPMIFVGLIMAIITRNTYSSHQFEQRINNPTQSTTYNTSEQENLRQAFMSGVITSKEYETKKAALKKKRIAEINRES